MTIYTRSAPFPMPAPAVPGTFRIEPNFPQDNFRETPYTIARKMMADFEQSPDGTLLREHFEKTGGEIKFSGTLRSEPFDGRLGDNGPVYFTRLVFDAKGFGGRTTLSPDGGRNPVNRRHQLEDRDLNALLRPGASQEVLPDVTRVIEILQKEAGIIRGKTAPPGTNPELPTPGITGAAKWLRRQMSGEIYELDCRPNTLMLDAFYGRNKLENYLSDEQWDHFEKRLEELLREEFTRDPSRNRHGVVIDLHPHEDFIRRQMSNRDIVYTAFTEASGEKYPTMNVPETCVITIYPKRAQVDSIGALYAEDVTGYSKA